MSTQTLNVRLADDLIEQLDRLAAASGRSRDDLAAEAIRELLDYEAWKEAKIQRAVEQADAGMFATDEQMEEAFRRYRPRAAE